MPLVWGTGWPLIVFVKYPISGFVKTRIGAVIGDPNSAWLYGAFVDDLTARLSGLDLPVVIAYDPIVSEAFYREWLGDEWCYCSQGAGSLGDRLCRVFEWSKGRGQQQAVVIGSDLPCLALSELIETVSEAGESDIVLGPCVDGGFYLVGLSAQCDPNMLFSGVPWSTTDTMQTVIDNGVSENVSCHLLDWRSDFDEWSDLVQSDAIVPALSACTATQGVLKQLVEYW